LKFQAVAEKTAKDARGYFILPHPVYQLPSSTRVLDKSSIEYSSIKTRLAQPCLPHELPAARLKPDHMTLVHGLSGQPPGPLRPLRPRAYTLHNMKWPFIGQWQAVYSTVHYGSKLTLSLTSSLDPKLRSHHWFTFISYFRWRVISL